MSKLHGSVEKKKKKKNSNGARDTRFTIETKKRILMVHEILDSQSTKKRILMVHEILDSQSKQKKEF